jgi:hypothetical protein
MIEHTCSGSPCGFCSQQEEIGALKAEREALRAEVGRLKRMSTVEMMCENESVRAHVTEWEERCLKAEAEVSRLQAQNVAPLVNKIDELNRDNMRLREALDKYGAHMVECSIADDGPCTCGYRAALSGGDGKTDRRSP